MIATMRGMDGPEGGRMHYLDLTLAGTAANLALDEFLLDDCDSNSGPEILRIWEPSEYAVVAGYSNKTLAEVDLDACSGHGIPVLTRHSGGGTVLIGPGCLNYAVVFRIGPDRPLSGIRATNLFVMERNRRMLERATGRRVRVDGWTDLVIGDRKVSGNAQHRRRHAVLIHGTFLLSMDLRLMPAVLEVPSVAPDYRRGRSHADFLANLDVPAELIKDRLRSEWDAFQTGRREELDGGRPVDIG